MSLAYSPATPAAGGLFMEFRADSPTPQYLVISNPGTATGYEVKLDGMEFGMPSWKHQFSGPRGTLGALPVSGTPENRVLSIPLYVQGTSKDNLGSRMNDLAAIVDGIRRYGGRVTFRLKNQTYKQHATVLAADGVTLEAWGESENQNAAMPKVELTVSPYLTGDPLDITDKFYTDSITAGDYTVDAGAAANVSVAQSRVNGLANLTTENRFIHSATGYTYAEGEATLKLIPGTTITSLKAGVILKRTASDTYMECYLDDDGTNSRLRIDSVVGGSRSNRKTVNLSARMTTGTPIWIRGRVEGAKIQAEYFTSEPTPAGTPANSRYYFTTPTGTVSIEFGPSRKGKPGIVFTPQSANASVTNFEWKPWTYNLRNLPESHMPQIGAVPGDADPLAEWQVSVNDADGATFAYLGWASEPRPYNLIYNGDFEFSTYGTAGWVVTAVSSVCGAATSITRVTTAAKHGTASAEVVVPNNATADKGASFRCPRPVSMGQFLFGGCWVRSAADTPDVQMLLGNTTDGVTAGTAVTLSSTWKFITCAMSTVLAADRTEFYVAVVQDTINSAATWQFDGLFVMDANPAIINGAISDSATSVVVDAIPDEWPKDSPFLITNTTNEIMRVTAISGTTLTIERAVEGTTAAAQSDGGALYVLPADSRSRAHYEGKGCASPGFGLIKAEGAISNQLTNWAVTADATYLNGSGLQYTTSSSPLSASGLWLFDPSLLLSADYASGTVSLEWFARIEIASTVTTPVATFSILPERGTNWGGPIYTDEWGSTGKDIVLPSSGTQFRHVRLGTVKCHVDRDNPLRYIARLTVTWDASASGTLGLDYLWCSPSNSRAMGPTGVANDSAYPAFTETTDETLRAIKTDLSGGIATPPEPQFPHHGLGGSLLEFPPNYRAMALIATTVPDDPTSDSASNALQTTVTTHYSLTPRWHILRT